MNIIHNTVDPYYLTTVRYSGTCNSVTGQTVSGYNVPTKSCNTTK